MPEWKKEPEALGTRQEEGEGRGVSLWQSAVWNLGRPDGAAGGQDLSGCWRWLLWDENQVSEVDVQVDTGKMDDGHRGEGVPESSREGGV